MAQRIARAVLALLCAVAVVCGTVVFPAAFDVELQSSPADAASAPATPTGATGNGPAETDTAATETETPSGQTETDRSTSSEETPTPAAGSSGSAGGGAGSLFLFLVFGFAGLVVFLTLGVVASVDGGSGSWLAALPLPEFLSRLSVPSGAFTRIPQLTTLAIISAGSGLARIADEVSTVANALGQTFAAGVGPLASALGRSLAAIPKVLGALFVAPVGALGSIGALVGRLGSADILRDGVARPDVDGSETPATDPRSRNGSAADPDDESEPVASVVEAWTAMTDLIRVRNPRSTTAAEYARRAVDAGLPAGPVERLTALFREVRYGGRPESADRVAAARRALDELTGGED